MALYPGYVMSPRQLNDLWHHDMFLAHLLLDLPLRKCSAPPTDLPDDFPPMKQEEYNMLRRQITSMWVKASCLFSCKEGEYGWGLFATKDFDKNSKQMFSDSKTLVLGWLARVPSPQECPTGHKYLRSPLSTEKFPMYLGGPVSLANFDPVNRVEFKRCVSDIEPLKNKVYIHKAKGRKIVEGQEILWSYSLNNKDRQDPHFFPDDEWQLDTCCSQVMEISSGFSISPASEQSNVPAVKKRKVGGQRPLMSSGEVTSHKFCTYCGTNLASELEAGRKLNLKRHSALKHCAHLCIEMGTDVDTEDDGVCSKAFLKHLDKVDHIYNSLKSHGYKVVPACNYFELNNTAMPHEEATPEEKDAFFHEFYTEARSAFYKYQVVYLKGITIPVKYEDLLKMDADSNYECVNWKTKRPSGINFSLNKLDCTAEEDNEHALDIKNQFTSIVLGWV